MVYVLRPQRLMQIKMFDARCMGHPNKALMLINTYQAICILTIFTDAPVKVVVKYRVLDGQFDLTCIGRNYRFFRRNVTRCLLTFVMHLTW